MNKDKILVVAGPTAVGKTEYAIDLALEFDGEIVSCDSMQLYKYMDIGSAKPTPEERAKVPHHLIDFVDPGEAFSVVKYRELANRAIDDIQARGKLPVIAGGTGLYLDSILYDMDFGPITTDPKYRKELEHIAKNNGSKTLHKKLEKLDPEAAKRIHPNNTKKLIRALEAIELGGKGIENYENLKTRERIRDAILIGLTRERQELYQRIDTRVLHLINRGLIEEVRSLMERGYTSDYTSMKGIGYKECFAYFSGAYNMAECIDTIQKNTRHFAKRQMTWFKRYKDMKWFDLSTYQSKEQALEEMKEWVRKNR